MVTNYAPHEYALLFPAIDRDAAMELGASIREEGLLHPIVLYQGKILDGRNRYNACVNLKIEPATVEYTGNDPLGYVVKSNLHRRQLTPEQRAKVAARLAELQHGQRKDYTDAHACASVPTQDDAAKALGVSRRSVQNARKVMDQCEPEVNEAVDTGKLGLRPAAEQLAGKPRDEQLEELERLTTKSRQPSQSDAWAAHDERKQAVLFKQFCRLWEDANSATRDRIRDWVS